MACSISSLRSQKDSGSKGPSTSSDSKVSSTCGRDSGTRSANSDTVELQDNKFDASPPQSPFSPRMVEEHQRRPEDDELSSCTHGLRNPRALYMEIPSMDVKQRGSSVDSIRAVWGSPKRHSERFLEFQSSRESEEAPETRSSNCPNAFKRDATSSPRPAVPDLLQPNSDSGALLRETREGSGTGPWLEAQNLTWGRRSVWDEL
ncbi:uncharacterized protein FSUBG_5481 [Fusarium subglutinans]|uniref:Uncharacterized protein n=1 Tax=Gibberella subglutinans TaxID=42677 RepID=A0A8H5V2J8_GIBSU|nr:uncharacterized protein FSUBG_5481 [Fusarium subglutinans]KAF5607023.1 hypothetical protein FSUBG_5481 [Fusarium subglutinans]